MPALSPTMTEGNISKWNIKEGDSFTAGDVILEIETDKATMDVEAQDDGVLFKIMQPDGAKGVKVGERIAVLAEEGDDLSSLEVPKDEGASAQKQGSAPKHEASASESKPAAADSGASDSKISKPVAETPPQPPKGSKGKPRNQAYPLFPSVQQLLHENGMSNSEADKISASGPNGRLLKGDVLAYLGKISKDYPSQSAERLEKMSHLDLSNITLAEPKKKPEAPKQAAVVPEIELPSETEIAVPVSLTAVIAVQKRVQDTLGIFLPLSTFIARASELANQDLPARKRKPTAEDLFNSVLGLDKVSSKVSRGDYLPEITALSPAAPPLPRRIQKADIIDVLAAPKSRRAEVRPEDLPAALGVSAGDNIFSVTAKVGEEERVTEYLERLKVALEKEPGRLVL
jgi:pyruvate/2-oxoglutarate dehydrogenase complex dihydrolipoamide acyltransferase (E2) component